MEAQTSMQQVQELIKRVRMDPKADNKPVLGVNIIKLQTAKNGGFPKHMYHEQTGYDPVVALSPEEEMALAGVGYTEYYIKRDWPRWVFRRNMDPKFTDQKEPQSNGTVKMVPNPHGDFVEAVLVKTDAEFEALKKRRAPASAQGPWVFKVTELEELPAETFEDPAVTIARLQGQLAAMQSETKGAKQARV